MAGHNARVLENGFDDIPHDGPGRNVAVPIPLNSFQLVTGAIIPTGSGNVRNGVAGTTNTLSAIQWVATATTADIIRLNWTLPFDFRRDWTNADARGNRPRIVLAIQGRQALTGTFDATLGFSANAVWASPTINHITGAQSAGNAAANVLAANVNVLTPALFAEAALDGLRWYFIDITAAMTAAQRRGLRPGAAFNFSLAPTVTVGTNLRLDITSAQVIYRAHANVSKFLRNRP
jgi:hypothetical protein